MPRVGMRHVVAARIDIDRTVDGQPIVYEPGIVATRAVSANITYNRDENMYFSDDVMSEEDDAMTSGEISLEGSEFLPDAKVMLFNVRKIEEDDRAIYRTTAVPSPYIGLGYVTVTIYKGVYKYMANWIHKMQFALSGDNARTKGETIEWQNETATGSIMGVVIDETGEPAFIDQVEFTSAKDAEDWLDEKAGITTA